MKTIGFGSVLLLALLWLTPSVAQEQAIPTAAPAAEALIWVTEYNANGPARTIVRIYDQHDQVVTTHTIEGRRLDINRRKVRRQLDRLATEAAQERAWAQGSRKKEVGDRKWERGKHD